MKTRTFFIILLCVAIIGLGTLVAIALHAQDKPVPAFPDSAKVKILQIQLQQTNMRAEYVQLQARMKEIEGQFPQTQGMLAAAQDEAYKDAKVDKKDFSIDLAKLEFVPVPKPPAKQPPEKQ
jgi:hypothetical protein